MTRVLSDVLRMYYYRRMSLISVDVRYSQSQELGIEKQVQRKWNYNTF